MKQKKPKGGWAMGGKMPGLIRGACTALLLNAACSLGAWAQVQTNVPADPYNYSRSTSYTYTTDGLPLTETIEPDNAQSCVQTTYTYDPTYGNLTGSTIANCTNATGHAVFTSRNPTATYAAQTATITVNGTSQTIAILAGTFADTQTNAESLKQSMQYDPRYGTVTKLTDPNSLSTTWVYDEFGRKVKESRPDGTSTYTWYCVLSSSGLDQTSNTSNTIGSAVACPTPGSGEAPADAVAFVHTQSYINSSNAAYGPFTRVYIDRLGREIRTVTQSFDGGTQPSARISDLVVKDTIYNAYGAKTVETQPYFLSAKSSTVTGSNDIGLSKTVYDVLGRPVSVYVADPHGSQANASFGNDLSGTAFASRQASLQSYAYSGLTTTITNDKGQTRKEEKNALGQVVRITDANGAQLAQQYDAFGNLAATKDALQNTISLTYSIRGWKTKLNDPDTGIIQYDYDALGQLVWQQNALQAGLSTPSYTAWTYDRLGRMTQRADTEYTSNWYFDKYADGSACSMGKGKLCDSVANNKIKRHYVYDSYGRSTDTRTTVTGGPSFATTVSYDSASRIDTQTYPTGVKVGYGYTSRGFLQSLKLKTAVTVTPLPSTAGGARGTAKTLAVDTVLWQANQVNAWGKAEQQAFSNSGVNTNTVFEAATGRTTDITAGLTTTTTVLNHHYVWDSLNNLVQRNDNNGDGVNGAVTESYTYGDNLNRLTAYTISGAGISGLSRTVNLQYNALGMLLYKSDTGVYTYNASGASSVQPHALQRLDGFVGTNTQPTSTYVYDVNGNVKSGSGGKFSAITYNSFNLPDSQTGLSGSGSNYTWQYDENHARIQEVRVRGTTTRTTWFLHPDNVGGLSFESETNPADTTNASGISNRHYLSVGGNCIGVLITTGALPTLSSTQTAPVALASVPADKLEYWHKDHLGSLAATTDANGNVTARYAYDPFGKRRYTNGSYDPTGVVQGDWNQDVNYGTDRGFTGHEHLDDVGLIHMNGRIYNPALGVFLQADPFISQPNNLQSYNRYAYLTNNPLNDTDPSGFFAPDSMLSDFSLSMVNNWDDQQLMNIPAFNGSWTSSGYMVQTGINSNYVINNTSRTIPTLTGQTLENTTFTFDITSLQLNKSTQSLKDFDAGLAKEVLNTYIPTSADLAPGVQVADAAALTFDSPRLGVPGKTILDIGQRFIDIATPIAARASVFVGLMSYMGPGNNEDAIVSDIHHAMDLQQSQAALSTNGSEANSEEGCIYCVKGDKTSSGKDYIGSTDNMGNRQRDKSDGRDRQGAEVVDTYPKGNRDARRTKEQQAINDRGGVDKLDNKRNEVAPKNWSDKGITPP